MCNGYNDSKLPTVTMITAAYNEEDAIREKLESFCNLDYPKHLIKLFIVSDRSTDRTEEIVKEYIRNNDNIKLFIVPFRSGKAAALNYIEPYVTSDIVISSDASSILTADSIKKLVCHFKNNKIGLVSGRLKYINRNKEQSGEGLYWKYESFIRSIESRYSSIICASGCLFAIRRELYGKIHPSSPDDFERTLIVLKKGYKAIIEPDAIVKEYVTEKFHEEISRKIRIISREWFALFRHSILLNPFMFPKVSFLLISHKLLRWAIFMFNIGLLISLFYLKEIIIFRILLFGLSLIYVLGVIEILLEKKGKPINLIKIIGYYVAMNYASFIAFIKFIFGKQQKIWTTNKKSKYQ